MEGCIYAGTRSTGAGLCSLRVCAGYSFEKCTVVLDTVAFLLFF